MSLKCLLVLHKRLRKNKTVKRCQDTREALNTIILKNGRGEMLKLTLVQVNLVIGNGLLNLI